MLTKTPRNGKNGRRLRQIAELPKINNTTDTRDILTPPRKRGKTTISSSMSTRT